MTYQFSPVLPAGFENAQVKLAASEFKEGKGYIPVESDGKTHYYIDRAFQENNVPVPYDQLYAIYEFTVAEAGEYSFCFDLRVKDATERETYFSVDNGETIRLHHLITDANLKDATNSTYMTGYKVQLTAGTHTFKLSVSEDNKATIHFRNFYVLKTGDAPVVTTTDSTTTSPTTFDGIYLYAFLATTLLTVIYVTNRRRISKGI